MAEIEGMGNQISDTGADAANVTEQASPTGIAEQSPSPEVAISIPPQLTQAFTDNGLLPGDFGVSAEEIANAPDGTVFKTQSGITLTKNGQNSFTVLS